MPFKSPNHTQTPNDLFDQLLPSLGTAELKVVLSIIRLTLGYHRKRSRASLTKLEKMTGLTRESILTGAAGLEEKGLILKIIDGGVTEYELILEDDQLVGLPDQSVGLPDQSGRRIRPRSIKETVKQSNLNNNGGQAPTIADTPAAGSIKLAPATPGGFILFNLIGDEFAAKGRRSPKTYPSLLCKQKFEAAEELLGGIELEKAIRRAIEKPILSISGITDFVAKWAVNLDDSKKRAALSDAQDTVDRLERYQQRASEARSKIDQALAKEGR